jgi:hypothetical protein
LVVGLGYTGLATYLCTRFHKFSPWELASISLGSMVLGYGLFDLGKRAGMVQGASHTLQNGDGKTRQGEGQDWRGEFTGMEYKQLNTSEKIVWLKKEEVRIREMQGEKQLNCGKAYIAKEEAYVAYEKHGGCGGEDWKRGMCDLMARDIDADVLAGIQMRMECVKRYIRSTRSSREGWGR